jgi:hypothetical protein
VAFTDFEQDFAQQYLIVSVSDELLDSAAKLPKVHALRGYDAVQLAAAFEVWAQSPTAVLVSGAAHLNGAALSEGMAVENPNARP